MKNNQKWIWLLVVGIIIAGAGGWFLASFVSKNHTPTIDTAYQAVFLTNGQVYFGKLTDQGKWMTLTDIYYLQTDQNQTLQQGAIDTTKADQQSKIQLIKLGSELHGPEDAMHIEHDKILFWENMTDDSKVVQAIKNETKK